MTTTASPQKNLPLLDYAWTMKKNGKAEETITTAITRLNRISKECNIDNPEQVKGFLANANWNNNSKHSTVKIITQYYKYKGIQWNEPTYKKQERIPFIPTEQEIDSLIASAYAKRTSAYEQLLKETGARTGEALRTQWKDIDLERKTIYITAEKGSNDRILPITDKLIGMLNLLPREEKPFNMTKHAIRLAFEKSRNKASEKLNNPRLKEITLHTFRHWKGTTEYHKTRDIYYVKTILGHKSVKSTEIYINLEKMYYLTQSNEWTCKTAKTVEEATQLIETGFEYITDYGTNKLFRKRK